MCRVLFPLFLLLSLAVSVTVASVEFDVEGKKIHSNHFYFDSNSTVVVQFIVNRTVITHGQPYKGVDCEGNRVTVHAGRKGSSEPAAEFNDGISLLNMVATEKILDAEPKDLNFVVFGTLSLAFAGGDPITCHDFRLGQGHVLFTNNWWLGSPKLLFDGGDLVYSCVDKIGLPAAVQFHVEDHKSDRINVLQF